MKFGTKKQGKQKLETSLKTTETCMQFSQDIWSSNFSGMSEEMNYNPVLAHQWAQDEE